MKTKHQKIIPAVLEKNLEKLYAKIDKMITLSKYIHIDYVDETFNNHFEYKITQLDFTKLENTTGYNYELHYLSSDFDELQQFLATTNKKPSKVIIHLCVLAKQSLPEQTKIISELKKTTNIMIAINPDECLNDITNFFSNHQDINEFLLMTVKPGKQNTKFLNNQYLPYFLREGKQINVDGGINGDTIPKLPLGINQYVVGSYLAKVENPEKNLRELEIKIDNF